MTFIIDPRDEALFAHPLVGPDAAPTPPRRPAPAFGVIIRPQDGPVAHPNLATALEAAAEAIAGRDFILTVSLASARDLDTFRVVSVMVRSSRKAEDGRSLPEFCCGILAGDEPPVQFIDAALTRAGLRALMQHPPVQVVRTLNPSH